MKSKYKNHKQFEETDNKREDFFYFPNIESLIKAKGNITRPSEISTIVTNEKTQPSNRLSLCVEDNGLENTGISKGDYVVIWKENTFFEGDIIAIRFEGQNLIRRLFHSKKQVILKSDEGMNPPIILEKNSTSLNILGRVLQVIKEVH